jgi:RNA recognition motif-containing protein
LLLLFVFLQIKKINMMMNSKTDVFKGFAYVEFDDKDSLQKSLLLDGMTFEQKPVKIDVAGADQGEPKLKTSTAAFDRPARGRGRGGVPFQRATEGPGSERFNRDAAEPIKKPAPAPAPSAVVESPKETIKPEDVDRMLLHGNSTASSFPHSLTTRFSCRISAAANKPRKKLNILKKGAAPQTAPGTTATGAAAKPKKPSKTILSPSVFGHSQSVVLTLNAVIVIFRIHRSVR